MGIVLGYCTNGMSASYSEVIIMLDLFILILAFVILCATVASTGHGLAICVCMHVLIGLENGAGIESFLIFVFVLLVHVSMSSYV